MYSYLVQLGYDRKGVLRTGTGNRICPNTIPEPELQIIVPVLALPEPEIGFHRIWTGIYRYQFSQKFNVYQKAFVKVRYEF